MCSVPFSRSDRCNITSLPTAVRMPALDWRRTGVARWKPVGNRFTSSVQAGGHQYTIPSVMHPTKIVPPTKGAGPWLARR